MKRFRDDVIGLRLVLALLLLIVLAQPATARATAGPPPHEEQSSSNLAPEASTVTLFPTQDTYVMRYTGNHGTETSLRLYGWDCFPTTEFRSRYADALLQFDLSTLPPGASITGASLQLYGGTTLHDASISVYRAGGAWNESIVDAVSAPPRWGPYTTSFIAVGTPAWHEWDVTALVRDWVRGTVPNYGLELVVTAVSAPQSDQCSVGSYSSREAAAGARPRLVVTYSGVYKLYIWIFKFWD